MNGAPEIAAPPAAPAPAAARWPLPLAIGVIVCLWISAAATHLLRAESHVIPGGVRAIAVGVAVKTVITLVAVWLLLRADGERIAGLGLSPGGAKGFLMYGLLPGVALFLAGNFVITAAVSSLMGHGGPSALPDLFRDRREAPLWIFCGVVGGGFTEELERAFYLTRFEKVLGRPGLIAAIVAGSAVFGTGHLYQGRAVAVSTAITGFLNALIFLRRRRVVDAMIAHAVFDLIGIAGAYAIYAG